MLNLKFVALGSAGALSVAGVTTFYFLAHTSSNKKEATSALKKTPFFKTKFPNMNVMPVSKGVSSNENKTFWLPKISKLEGYYKDTNKDLKPKLLASMRKVLPSKLHNSIDKYMDVKDFSTDADVSAFLLSQYCNAVWNSSEEHSDAEEIVKDLCVKEAEALS